MFNNIIYFIIALLLFNINRPDHSSKYLLLFYLFMIPLFWVLFAGTCASAFRRLLTRFEGVGNRNGRFAGEYHTLIARLSILALFLFALDVYLFQIKTGLRLIPGATMFSVLEGLAGIALFLFYLITLWALAYPAYKIIFRAQVSRRAFLLSHVKLNMPILFPWIALTFLWDMVSLSPWPALRDILNQPVGQLIFFGIFLFVLMIFMPRFIQYWWGCRPFTPSQKVREMKHFLKAKGFRYREMLNWTIFEGRMMTAGIMGIVPRYRYILVTEGLMELLTLEELKAVLSHEMGHAKYRHMLFYVIFMLGYMVLSFGFFELFFYFFASNPFFLETLGKGEGSSSNLFYLSLSLPVMASLFIYFRFVMGFFMRHFERQADLYSAVLMGVVKETVQSLEKIALVSGKIRDLPSWHHFSIRQRVDYLDRYSKDRGLLKAHNRFIAVTLGLYFLCVAGLSLLFYTSPLKQAFTDKMFVSVLVQEIDRDPRNVVLYEELAMIYHRLEKYPNAIEIYERVVQLDPDRPLALNNLAWLFVTCPDPDYRDAARALALAKKAVALDRSAIFLDTLAEAYYANGLVDSAVETIKEADMVATRNKGYYKRQLKRFLAGKDME